VEGHNNYVLVAMDGTGKYGELITAGDLVEFRLNVKQWPLYRKTRNRLSIVKDDCLLFYCGGKKTGGLVVGFGYVNDIVPFTNHQSLQEFQITIGPTPELVIELKKVTVFPTPLPLKSIVTELECYPTGSNKWGTILQGGCRKISDRDCELILSSAQCQ
jgi:hypothetical protein